MKTFKEYFQNTQNEGTKYFIKYDNNPTGSFSNEIEVSKDEFDKVKKLYNKDTGLKTGFNKFIVNDNTIELGYNHARHAIDKTKAKVLDKPEAM